MEYCQLPRTPSEVLQLGPELGLDYELRVGFDLACLAYVKRLNLEREATKMEPMKKLRKGQRAQVPVPKWGRDDLLRFMGIDPADSRPPRYDQDPAIMDMAAKIRRGAADWL